MKVTDKDREAYTAADSHEATALLSALRNMHCDQPHYIIGPPCQRCLSTVHDALATAIGVIRRQAIATARAEEREQCLMLCQRIAQRYESAAAAVGAFGTPREMAAQECAAAIRARGEDR